MKSEKNETKSDQEMSSLIDCATNPIQDNSKRADAIYRIGEILAKKDNAPKISKEIATLINIGTLDSREDIRIEAHNVLANLGFFKEL